MTTTAPDPRPSILRSYGAPALVFALSLALYLRTLMPGQAFDDWGELQTVPHVLGVPHPTGYPTYVLAAWLFELLPVGSIAFRANLFAAVCVALALAVMVSIQQRLGVRPLVAAGIALATGATGSVWASAGVAEVNSLHLLFIALIFDRSLAWARSHRLRDLALGGLLIGLSLGNHVLSAFTVPYVVLFVLWSGRGVLRANRRWILAPVATMLLGLSVYAYLPIAASMHPPLPYNNPVTIEGFLFLVTGAQFRGQYSSLLGVDGVLAFLGSLPQLAGDVVRGGGVVLPLLGLAGVPAAFRRSPGFAAVLVATVLTSCYVWANYLRMDHYLLVPWLATGILAGIGLDAITGIAERRLHGPARVVPGLVAAAAGGVLAVSLIVTGLPDNDRSGDRTAEVFSDALLALLPENAAVVTPWGPSTALWYATLVDGKRPDVLVVDDTNIVYEGWETREARIASLICSRPVYALRVGAEDLELMRRDYLLTAVARLVVGQGEPGGWFETPLFRVDPKVPCG